MAINALLSVSENHAQSKSIRAFPNNYGQVTVYGKGRKTRTVLLKQDVWLELMKLKGDRSNDEPVFQSRKGGHINRHQLWRIVSAAAKRAGIEGKVSPHWLRHAHASHSLDRGAPLHLVQQIAHLRPTRKSEGTNHTLNQK